MRIINKVSTVVLSIMLMVGMTGHANSAATAVDFQTASGFAVMAGAAISDTATASSIIGDVGLSPTGGTGITQLSCTDVTGTIYDTNGGYTGGHDSNTACLETDATLLTTAKADLSIAYNEAKDQPEDFTVTASTTDSFAGTGYTLTPGVYESGSTMGVPISLTLDGGGDPNAVFIFQAGTTLNTVSGSTITLTGGAKASNVFWQVGSSATLGTGSTFEGNIMAAVSITDNGGSTIRGRLLADADNTDADSTGAVTLNDTTIVAPTTLNVIKTVINDNGGTAVASDFTINVTGTNVSPSSFAGSEDGVTVSLDAGSYAVTEIVPPEYAQTGSADCSGTIATGETKTCTITNNDIAPQIIVNKVVVNDDGGNKEISDFDLFLDDVSVTSGVATTTTIGEHTVSETPDAGYTTTISGDCAADGTVTVALGDVKTCTVTNNDIAPASGGGGSGSSNTPTVPPQINVVKVPNPLSLPAGPGSVEYTYTLTNIGEVPVNSVTMVDDSCSSVTFVSGDANSNARLDEDETWTYTCSTTLSETHTNIVTATGQANGITTTDTATATVVVGLSVVPPIINVTKTPNPLSLAAGGGTVAYTMRVSNPGDVALSNILLTDDKCSPVTYISGDTNDDAILDTDETWVYTCAASITETTVNTVTAKGEANGLTARDFASATVVVNDSIPALPSTGLPPAENNMIWNIIISIGVLGSLTSFYFIRRKLIS